MCVVNNLTLKEKSKILTSNSVNLETKSVLVSLDGEKERRFELDIIIVKIESRSKVEK